MAQTSYAIPNQSIPGDVYQQAGMYQLGELTAVYKPKYSNPLLVLAIFLGATVLDIVALFALAYFTDRISLYLLIIPILVLIWTIRTLPHCNLRAYVFTNGIVHAKGSQIDVVRWDQTEAIWQKITQNRRSMSYTYTVRRAGDGKVFTFTDALVGIATLGSTIQLAITNVHLPQAIAAYEAGRTVSFGKVNVDMQGVNNGKEIIPWDQIGNVVVQKGLVTVQKSGQSLKWTSVRAMDVPNIQVLIGLVDHIVRRKK